MPENEDRLMESNDDINVLTEAPSRPFVISIEFPLFLILMAVSLSGAALGNIILYRTCVHSLHHEEMICREFLKPDRSNETRPIEEEVQKYATLVTTVKTFLESVGPAMLSLFIGVWSDTYGRKPLMVWPIFGMALSSILTVVYSMMNNLGPWWYILTVIPSSLGGGYTVLFTGAFCYLSDITSTANRTIRMTILESAVAAGSVVGGLLSSYLLKAVGNVILLLIVAALLVIAYVYTNLYVRESLTGALDGGLKTVLDFLLVKEMFTECFKRRPNHMRAQILLLIFANCLSIFVLYGLAGLEYMYTREKLQWAMQEYTLYSASSTLLTYTVCFIGVVIAKKLKISDLTMSFVAFICGAAEYLIKAFATVSWQMYVATAASSLKGLSSPLIRSFLTKILPVEDIAKVFALTCAIEGICPLVSPVTFNSLYALTLSTFPGAIYILSCNISVLSIVLLGFVAYFRIKYPTVSYTRVEAS